MTISNKSKGIFYILLAAFFLSLNSICIRMAGDINSMEKAFFRNAVSAVFAAYFMLRERPHAKISKKGFLYVMIRAVFGGAAVACYYFAIDRMYMADVTILNGTAPFWAILFSALLLREKIGPPQVLAVVAAMVGSILIVKPTAGLLSSAAIIAAFSGVLSGFSYIGMRAAGREGVRDVVTVLAFSLISCLLVLPSTIRNFQVPSLMQLFFMIACGFLALLGQLCMVRAYRFAPAKEISIYDYSQGIFTAIWGVLLFAEIPDVWSICGYAVIIGFAIYLYYIDRKK